MAIKQATEDGRVLNARQQAFCRHVAAGASGAEAARAAGYMHGNARQQASKLLQRRDVADAIEALRREGEAARRAGLERALALTQQIIEGAMRQGHWHAALRGLELELKLRKQGAAPGPHALPERGVAEHTPGEAASRTDDATPGSAPEEPEEWAEEWPQMPEIEFPETVLPAVAEPVETPPSSRRRRVSRPTYDDECWLPSAESAADAESAIPYAAPRRQYPPLSGKVDWHPGQIR